MKITGVAAQAERSLATLEGRQTRLGFSANTLVGINRSLLGQLGNFGPVGNVAAAGFDNFGGAMVGIPTLAGGVVAGVAGIGIATAALVRKGIPELQTYQAAMNVLAASGETDLGRFKGELEALQLVGGKAAESFSRSQLAGALAETVKAGTSADEAMKLLRTSTQLAGAESQDLGESTALVLQNLRQFDLGVEDAARAGDSLASAGNLAAGSTKDLSVGLSTVGPVAKAAGLSLEETLGILVNLDNKGLSAAETGATGLRSVLSALADATPKARDELEGLGVSLDNADGSARSASEVLFDLKDALSGSEEAMSAAAKIFDTQGITTILALDETTEQYTKTIEAGQGSLNAYAAQMANGLAPAQDRANAAMADLAATAAETFAPALASSADGLNRLLTEIDNFLTGGAAGVSTILGIAKAIGDASDSTSLLGAAEALEKKLSGDSREAIQGLIADLQAGVKPTEEIAAALLELGKSAALEPLERDVSEAQARVTELTAFLEQAGRQNPLQNLLTVGSPEELRQALAQAQEDLRQAEAEAAAVREQLDALTGAASEGAEATGELSESLKTAQAEVANTVNALNFGGYLNDMFIRLSIEDPDKLLAEVQSLVSQTEFKLEVEPNAELEGELGRYQQLLEVVQLLVATQEEAASAPPPTNAPDPAPFDAATASITRLNEERARLEAEFNQAPGGSELQRSLGAQIAKIDETISGYNGLTKAASELTDAQVAAAAGATKAGDAAAEEAGRVSLTVKAYASVAEAVGIIPKAYAKVTDAQDITVKGFAKVADSVDISNKAFAQVKPAVDIGVKAYAQVADSVDIMVKAYATVPKEVAIPVPEVKPIVDFLKILESDLPKAYKAAEDANKLLEGGLSQAEVRAEVAKEKLQELIDQVLDPQSEAVQKARAEWLLYQNQVDSAAEANANLAGVFGILADGLEGITGTLSGLRETNAEIDRLRDGTDATAQSYSTLDTVSTAAIGGLTEGLRQAASLAEGGFTASEQWTAAGYAILGAADALSTLEGPAGDAAAAISDIAGGALAGSAAGPWGALAGAVVGFFSAMVNSAAASAEEIKRKYEELQRYIDSLESGYDKTIDAGLDYQQSELDNRIAGRGGTKNLQDILDQQAIDIGRANQKYVDTLRDIEADKQEQLDLLGDDITQAERDRIDRQAADRTAIAEGQYSSDVQGINNRAYGEAEAIGEGGVITRGAIDQNGKATTKAWADYYGQIDKTVTDAEEQRERRLELESSRRYRSTLAFGGSEDEALQRAAEKHGYVIDETTGEILTHEEKAARDRANGSQAAGVTAASGVQTGTQTELSAIGFRASSLLDALAFSNTQLSIAGGDTGLVDALNISSNLLTSALGANLSTELSAIGGRASAITQAITGGANLVSSATINAGNFEKSALEQAAAAKLAQEQLNTDILTDARVRSGNFQIKNITGVGNALSKQHTNAGNANAKSLLSAAQQQIKQTEAGSNALANTFLGGGNFVLKASQTVDAAKAKQFIAGGQAQSDALYAAFKVSVDTAVSGAKALAEAIAGNTGAAGLLKKIDIGSVVKGAIGAIKSGGIGKVGGIGKYVGGGIDVIAGRDPQEIIDNLINGPGAIDLGDITKARDAALDLLEGGKGKGKDDSGKGSSGGGKGKGKGKGGSGGKDEKTAVDDEIEDLDRRIKNEKDPKKRAALKKKRDELAKERSKAGGGKGGKGGSAGAGREIGPPGSPSYLKEQIRQIEEQIDKAASPGKIRELQAKRDKLQAQIDNLLGTGDKTKAPAKGSIDALQKAIQDEQAKFDSATTDKARNESAARLKVLQDELKEKQAILKDAQDAVNDAYKGSVINIESPLADLSSITELLKPSGKTGASFALGQAALPTSAASITALPAYQAQLDAPVAAFGSHVSEFGGYVREFGGYVRGMRTLRTQGGNELVDKAHGRGVSSFTLGF